MNKKIKSTYDEFVESLNKQELKEFKQGYESLLVEEMVMAAMKKDNISVRKLAKMAGVSPTIIQSIRSGTRNPTQCICCNEEADVDIKEILADILRPLRKKNGKKKKS